MFRKFGSSIRDLRVSAFGHLGSDAGAAARWPFRPVDDAGEENRGDFFNGIECVRFDRGSGAGPTCRSASRRATPIELEFPGVGSAEFESVARYYDGRKAAYTLSNDNWGCNAWAHPGAPWRGPTDDESDNYQAALHVCRGFHLPRLDRHQQPLGRRRGRRGGSCRRNWTARGLVVGSRPSTARRTPRTPPPTKSAATSDEILGCREDILQRLHNIPYGQYVFEHILTHGYEDETIQRDRRRRVPLPPRVQLARQPVEQRLRRPGTRSTASTASAG